MTTVYLARHGSHDEIGRVLSGRSEIALNALGRAEGAWLGERLANAAISTIVTSPRRRARQTSDIVAERLGLPVQTDVNLDEIDFGDWAGQRFDTLDKDLDWRRWNRARGRAATPAGDTMVRVAARAYAVVQRVAPGGEPVLLVSHCDVIRAVVARTLGLGLERVQAFSVDPGSLSAIEVNGWSFHLKSLNERMR